MNKPDKKLFLLDAMALIYRAHFAFSKTPRINSKGQSTGASLGFTNTLFEVIQKRKPTHIGVAFDTSAPTFRHKQYTEYKAGREEMPEDIASNLPYIRRIIEGFGIPILEMDGFEADDIVGTLAKKASKQGFEVYMMTSDKDYAQLVDEHIYLYKPAFMGNGVDILGIEEVKQKFEIDEVDQVRDLLGLQGDKVDNIPGIPGIGAKTAIKLLKAYGTVENLLANTDDLKGKQKENVVNFGQQGIMSKELATIKLDVPIELSEDDLLYNGPNEETLTKLFEELEFRTLLKRVLNKEDKKPKTKAEKEGQMTMFEASDTTEEIVEEQPPEKKEIHSVIHDYHLIDTPDLRKSLIEYLLKQDEFCFDTETTSIEPVEAELVGIAFSYFQHEAYYVPIPEDQKEAQKIVNEFRVVLEHDKIVKIGQNLKYDIQVLKNYDLAVQGPFFDTMLAHYLIDPETRHNMDVLAENYLNYSPVSISTLIGKKGGKQGNMRDVAVEKVVEYAGEDADITLQLKNVLSKDLQENLLKLFEEVEVPLVNVLADMEYQGVKIDVPTLESMSIELRDASAQVEKEIYDIAGAEFNIASPKQLGEILFDKLKLVEKPKKTKTGQYATGEDILSKLAKEHEIANKIMEFREYQKLKSTYVDALPKMVVPKDGRVHTDYRQAVAATGRLSSNNPNLQNIPIRTAKGREIRKAFIPCDENHTLVSADYSQVELRIVAAFAQDESMIEAFKNGRDIHATTASKVFRVALEEVEPGMRRKAKEVNFGIIYGISAFGLAQNLGISRTEAKEIIDAYFEEFPAIKRYMDNAINEAREKGYAETILGRRRYLRDINSRNMTVRGFAERNAINAPIQGSAADIIKIAMINIHQWLQKEKLKSKMILQVHDELVFDAHNDELELLIEKIPELMKNAVELAVPLEVEVGTGKNWLEAH
ncbi:DNA polymerase I [Fulvivirgaceae bacterium BMA12]|uniref:DNA polymerase I n=1 Tax=Agaribacillus aureus TaxID=3051825 RepID=A0ABT8LF58_9BACT|nr:DNA polymerase I [Fulvivirgaceae bacterium BMA12]